MPKRTALAAVIAISIGSLLGWLSASGHLAFAQDKANPGAPPTAVVVDGSILPFPATPSASTAGLTMQDSIYKKRIDPSRLPKDAPNILIILMDDAGPGLPATYGGEIQTPTLDRVANAGISFNRFHSTAMCSPTRGSLLTGRNHTRIGNGQICELANDWDGFSGIIPKSSATGAEVLKDYGYRTGAWGKWHNTPPCSSSRRETSIK
jgi:Sulfatase